MVVIGMILFEGFTQLDLTGPYEIFSRLPQTKIILLSKELHPVKSDSELSFTPTKTLNNCPHSLDVLFIPGGPGVSQVMTDRQYIDFIIYKGKTAKFVTAVCTGSLVLAAAGLLDGYKATTHWLSLDLLRKFRVDVCKDRVVIDRNRITGGGVTSGIDFALTLAAHLYGEDTAKEIQLMVEYDPRPPFRSGHPSVADKKLVDSVISKRKEAQQARETLVDQVLGDKFSKR